MDTQSLFSSQQSNQTQFGSQKHPFEFVNRLFPNDKNPMSFTPDQQGSSTEEDADLKDLLEIVSLNDKLVSMYCKVKMCPEAIDCYKKSVDIKRKIARMESRPEDSTLCHNNDQLANILDIWLPLVKQMEKRGFYTEAEDHYNHIISLYGQAGFEKNERFASVYVELGSISNKVSKFDQALTFYNEALGIYTKLNKTDDVDAANVYEGMGSIYRGLEKGEECLKYLNMALEIRIRAFGNEDLSVAKIYDLFAWYYIDILDGNKAKEYCDMSLSIKLSKGCNHIELADCYVVFGQISSKKDSKFEEAVNYFNMALDIYHKEQLQYHPGIIEIYSHLAYIRHKQTRYQETLELCERAEHVINKLGLGPRHPLLGAVYENKGLAYNVQGLLDQALPYFLKSLDIRIHTFGEQHLSVANLYNSLGGYYHRRNMPLDALKYFQSSLDIRIKKFGEDHISLAIIYNNMAVVHNGQGDVAKSLDYLKKSLAIKEKNYGKDHVETAKSQYNIGIAYRRLEDYRLAIAFETKALATYIKVWGMDHIDVVKAADQLAFNLQSVGSIKEAAKMLQISVLANRRSPTKNPSETVRMSNALWDISQDVDQLNINMRSI